MKNILILGAHGKIAQLAEEMLVKLPDVRLTLFLRNKDRLADFATSHPEVTLLQGDASSPEDVQKALEGIDLVYANLAGSNIEKEAKNIVTQMEKQHILRLIWISTLGIYDEVPGEFGKWNHAMLDGGYLETYAAAAKIIETSSLHYTIIRPAWLTNHDEIDYELTAKGTPFKGTEVSRKSIADLVTKICQHPENYVCDSLGINKPQTDGSKPAWYKD